MKEVCALIIKLGENKTVTAFTVQQQCQYYDLSLDKAEKQVTDTRTSDIHVPHTTSSQKN